MSQRKGIFGVHQLTAYNVTTKMPIGSAKVLAAIQFGAAGELVELRGGSNKYPWSVEDGPSNADLSVTLREYPNWLYEAVFGIAPTENAAEASGAIATALTNQNGTSVLDATTGIASVTVKSGSEADLKTGRYVIKAVSSTTVDIYAMTDVDFDQGTDKTYADEDTLKITSSPLTITGTGGTTDVADFGLTLTGGSGTVAMTEGDTAYFDVRAINDGSETVKIGANGIRSQEIGLIITPQKRADNNEIVMLDVFRARASGMPMNFTENEWSEAELAFKAYRDDDRNGVFQLDRVRATN